MADFTIPTLQPRSKKGVPNEILREAWTLIGTGGKEPEWFGVELTSILQGYSECPSKRVSLPSKDRNKFYNNVEKATQTLLAAIGELPRRIEWELQDTYTCHEPENVDDILTGESEGLSYGEYELDRLATTLNTFMAMTANARQDHKPEIGRPNQNENLEQTIVGLAVLFKRVTGQAAMSTYTFQELDDKRPYQGPFLSFVTTLLWMHNGRQFPSNPTIGEAARKALGLRK